MLMAVMAMVYMVTLVVTLTEATRGQVVTVHHFLMDKHYLGLVKPL
jgi:hypothetical protein